MFPLIEFPELVQHDAPHFENVFSAEAFIQFKRYISGLILAENKTVWAFGVPELRRGNVNSTKSFHRLNFGEGIDYNSHWFNVNKPAFSFR